MLEAAQAVLGPRTLEAVTNNLTSLSSSRSRDNLKVSEVNCQAQAQVQVSCSSGEGHIMVWIVLNLDC